MIQKTTTPSRRPALARKLGALALGLSALSGGAWAAQEACTPQAGFNTCVRYTYSGAAQTFTVPHGVTSIQVTMWGAGGGGGMRARQASYGGGAGGYAVGTVSVTPGMALTVTVGQGGKAAGTKGTYGRGGGGGATTNSNTAGSSGGGMSALWNGPEFTLGSELLIAGGGGGSGYNFSIDYGQPDGKAVAGGGGGSAGGGRTTTTVDSGLTGGMGGTQTKGGDPGGLYSAGLENIITMAGSCANYNTTAPGKQFQGGTGCSNPAVYDADESGGGGGGGWYGGGGGMSQCKAPPQGKCSYNGPGGGGSGRIATGSVNGATVSNATLTQGSNGRTDETPPYPPNVGSTLYVAGIGMGGAGNSGSDAPAGHGMVVIQYNVATTLQLAKAWAANSLPGDAANIGPAVLGGAGITSQFTASAPGGASSTVATVAAGNVIVLPAETMTPAGALAHYDTELSCTADDGALASSLSSANGQQPNTLTIAAADLGKAIVCTYTNTRKAATVTLRKTWSGAAEGDAVLVIGTGLNALFSRADSADQTDAGPAQTVDIGAVIALGESFRAGSADHYTSALSCTGTSGLEGDILTVGGSDTDIVCTYTNTRKTATVTLRKTWSGATVHMPPDVVLVTGTGLPALVSVADAADKTDTGPTQIVGAGTVITLGEQFIGGSAADYASALNCTGTSGLEGDTLTVGGSDTDIVCTFTNTGNGASVRISKRAVGGSGSFAFGGDNGFGTDRIEVVAAGATVAGALKTLASANVQTTLTEIPAPGFRLTDVSCTGLTADAEPVVDLAAGTVTLPADGLAAGAAVACTFTNSAEATVSGRVFLDTGTGVDGIANDGVLNGDEAGLAGVTVRLTDCGASVYATTLTDGTGAYALTVPAAVGAGAALCVEKFNPPSLLSTGASVDSVALPSGAPTVAAGAIHIYTRDTTPERILFVWNGASHPGLNFGAVGPGTFAANGAKTGLPGNTVSYAHTFVAGTGGSVRFAVSDSTATPGQPGWSEKIFADPTCSGSLQAGAALLYPPPVEMTVTAGQTVCVVMEQFIAATAQAGDAHSAQLQASFTLSNSRPEPELSASYTLEDVTTVSTSALELKKEVRNVTRGVTSFGVSNQARSEETLEYRITYTNNGASPIGDLTVSDVTPAYTTFVESRAGVTPAALTACAKMTPANPPPAPAVDCNAAQAAGGMGALNWSFSGKLDPGETGSVLFQVKVD